MKNDNDDLFAAIGCCIVLILLPFALIASDKRGTKAIGFGMLALLAIVFLLGASA